MEPLLFTVHCEHCNSVIASHAKKFDGYITRHKLKTGHGYFTVRV